MLYYIILYYIILYYIILCYIILYYIISYYILLSLVFIQLRKCVLILYLQVLRPSTAFEVSGSLIQLSHDMLESVSLSVISFSQRLI